MMKEIAAPFWPAYLLGVILLVITDLLALLIPRYVGKAVDAISSNGNIAEYLGIIAVVAIIMAILRYFYREFILGTSRRLEHDLRARIFRHALRLPSAYYDGEGPGKVMALAVNDVTAVRTAAGLGVMLLVDAIVMGGVAFSVMFRNIDPALALWSVAPLPVIFTITFVLGHAVHERFSRVQEKFSTLTEFTQELLGGVQIIQAFGAEARMSERFAMANNDYTLANLSLARVQSFYSPLLNIAPFLCYAISLFAGGQLIIAGKISVGDFAAFTGYLGFIIWPIVGLGYLLNTVQRGSVSLNRIESFLVDPVDEHETEPATDGHSPLGSDVEVRNLTFTYPNAASASLNNVSLHIPAGATVGIVGRVGAGKSTLLRLLLRLYPVGQEMIFVGGEDISQMDVEHLRDSIGYVPQDADLFSATIGENIAFSRKYSQDEIWEAARLAVVEADIDNRAERLDTLLGEKGARLSGGQRQRVALARALVRKPAILLLDDVFAALDYQTQANLIENLRTMEGAHTTIVVSQRVAAVKHASFIAVMDKGTICEQGTHEELIACRGLYYKLYEQQLAVGEIV